jgi:hypothetical protein
MYCSVASEMQTSYESEYWKLFKSVRSLFASSIPWEVHDGSQEHVSAKIAIENIGDLIQACMMEIPIHCQIERFDSLDGFLFIADDLRPLLLVLQELICDTVLETIGITAVSRAFFTCLFIQ